jgi:hypothetical protein
MSDFFLRMGAFKNSMIPTQSAYGRGYGTGLGWVAPRIALDLGIERALEPRASTATTFGATIYF